MMKFRVLSALMLAVAVCSQVFSGEMGPGAAPALVSVGRVATADNVEQRRYTGHVVTTSSVELVARVSGEIMRLGFKEGDMIESGQVLYELDPVKYAAEVKNIEARIAEGEARLDYAELSHDRANNLYSQNAGTRDARDSSESEKRIAQASLLAAEAQLVTALDDLENTKIVAPISGKIGLTKYTAGNYITPNSGPIATIVQLDPLRVGFSMSNRDYLAMFGTEENLKRNADIRLRLADDSVYEHDGRVEFVNNQANQRTDTIQIYVSFANPDGRLVPGSTVTVLLTRRTGDPLPAVAPSAVMHDNKSAYVYVVDPENRVHRREVVLGGGTTRNQLVKSGLEAGELVVVDGMHKTMPGAIVETDYQG